MAKKIMMDMKLNKGKSNNSVDQPIESIHVPTSPAFDNPDALRRSSVFVSGWQKPENKEPVSPRKLVVNSTYSRFDPPQRYSISSPSLGKPKKSKKSVFLFFNIIILCAGIYAVGMGFEKTTVLIKEKNETVTLSNEMFNASKDVSNQIHFEVMSVSEKIQKEILLTQTQNVSSKAKGSITLYNEYGTKPQKLLINNFLSDSEGKMYRTDSTVTIPGYTSEGEVVSPGQIEVNVTAFLPGEAYNGTPTNFTIAAFKGLDKFKKIYGKANSVFTGGEQGITYTIGSDETASVETSANDELKNLMLKKISAQVPKGYIFYSNAFSFSSLVNKNVTSRTPQAKLEIEGNLIGIIFKENDMVAAVIKKQFQDISSDEISETYIPDISTLQFKFKDPTQQITKEVQSVAFMLSGTVEARWHPNYDLLKSHIVGKLKDQLPAVFKKDPGIQQATVQFFPPWQSRASTKVSNIDIKIE